MKRAYSTGKKVQLQMCEFCTRIDVQVLQQGLLQHALDSEAHGKEIGTDS